MSWVYELYGSFHDLYDSFFRGNEIEFRYAMKSYFILPTFDREKVVGVTFGEEHGGGEIFCSSEEELYHVLIGAEKLGEIISKTDLLWNNF